MKIKRPSDSTIHRLSVYYRVLQSVEKEGYHTVSSKELAKREKLTPAQVRKDLSFFGSFGTRGLGYPVRELREKIAKILGLDKTWNVALIGVGNMGSALASYKEFQRQGFHIKLVLDNDQRKIGSNHKGLEVRDTKDLEKELKANKIDMVILAVPANAAQGLAEEVQKTGVKAILNFAPVNLRTNDEIHVRSENMAMELEYLSFCLTNKTTPSSG
ncbi:MAG: redox-sensing transcriptional repressor Rex [candidate division Zixibacteria bacterium RBG_16_48_11]|nr:MAG: redox-sensing transcriptional repressor Rex [candidate division Zixibacteria bacterium RBG_16_48_11]